MKQMFIKIGSNYYDGRYNYYVAVTGGEGYYN